MPVKSETFHRWKHHAILPLPHAEEKCYSIIEFVESTEHISFGRLADFRVKGESYDQLHHLCKELKSALYLKGSSSQKSEL
jgi:hypothetical protein